MKYLCLIYVDDTRVASLPAAVFRQVIDECRCNEERLRENGQLLAAQALEPAETATTLRHAEGVPTITDGPFAETREHLGGFVLLEARDLNEALQIAGRLPSGRLGCVEVRPVRDWDRYFAGQ
ncbi:YciI family protein [Pseudomonas sp. MT3]|uniref:YciI family protein n=1 Tax=Pseudomonas sp. ATCC 13867 TaxID=1294143 RepID=UPI0002C4F4C5|nr:YciI family protein [Pseudomonas sp. ATCC 13867]AGI23097.1 hypothetical protein H681_06085 [Pseudomonas sp. ATCC 13867]RFQ29487.1 YciI family protein [Pseudomonas sp. ATCC 13867]